MRGETSTDMTSSATICDCERNGRMPFGVLERGEDAVVVALGVVSQG